MCERNREGGEKEEGKKRDEPTKKKMTQTRQDFVGGKKVIELDLSNGGDPS